MCPGPLQGSPLSVGCVCVHVAREIARKFFKLDPWSANSASYVSTAARSNPVGARCIYVTLGCAPRPPS